MHAVISAPMPPQYGTSGLSEPQTRARRSEQNSKQLGQQNSSNQSEQNSSQLGQQSDSSQSEQQTVTIQSEHSNIGRPPDQDTLKRLSEHSANSRQSEQQTNSRRSEQRTNSRQFEQQSNSRLSDQRTNSRQSEQQTNGRLPEQKLQPTVTETGELSCEECGKCFQSRQNLSTHMRRYHKCQPLTCSWPDCSKQYKHRWDLTSHVKTAHRGEKVACPHCGSCFSKKSNLHNHLKRGKGCPRDLKLLTGDPDGEDEPKPLTISESQSEEEDHQEEAASTVSSSTEAASRKTEAEKPTVKLEPADSYLDDNDEEAEADTPLMHFLKLNRELLQSAPGRRQRPAEVKTEDMDVEDNFCQPAYEDSEGRVGGMLISNLHLLAEIATRQTPSPPVAGNGNGDGGGEPPTELEEHVATTSHRLPTSAGHQQTPAAGVHILPLSVISGPVDSGKNRRPAVLVDPLAGGLRPPIPQSVPVQLRQPTVLADTGLLFRSASQLGTARANTPLMLAARGSGSCGFVLRPSGLLYGPSGTTTATAVIYPVPMSAVQGQPVVPTAPAAQTATLFSLAAIQPIMSVSEAGGVPRAAGDSVAAVPINSRLTVNSAVGAAIDRESSSSSSSRSNSPRDSSPKSSSNSPSSLNALAAGLPAGNSTAGGGERQIVRCCHCGRICSTLAHLNNHIRSAHSNQRLSHGPKTLRCSLCTKMFGRNSHLVEHMRTVHEGRKRVYQRAQCKDCGKEFARQCSLNQHLSTSHGGLWLDSYTPHSL